MSFTLVSWDACTSSVNACRPVTFLRVVHQNAFGLADDVASGKGPLNLRFRVSAYPGPPTRLEPARHR